MQEDGIAILRLRNHPLVGVNDVLVRGLGMLPIIEQHDNVLIFESVDSLDVPFHVEHIVPASAQFTGAIAYFHEMVSGNNERMQCDIPRFQ
jgi:hypothetical protein